jgi:hypothetical protein
LSPERYAALAPEVGERMYVQPRRLRVFAEDGQDASVSARAARAVRDD